MATFSSDYIARITLNGDDTFHVTNANFARGYSSTDGDGSSNTFATSDSIDATALSMGPRLTSTRWSARA